MRVSGAAANASRAQITRICPAASLPKLNCTTAQIGRIFALRPRTRLNH